jgi:hypothetical protein
VKEMKKKWEILLILLELLELVEVLHFPYEVVLKVKDLQMPADLRQVLDLFNLVPVLGKTLRLLSSRQNREKTE